jgi:hypothetical protein
MLGSRTAVMLGQRAQIGAKTAYELIEFRADLEASPPSLYRGGRRIDIIEIVDQWYGPGYRYIKVRTYDDSVYILLFDEIRDQWELIMFCTAPAQRWQRKHHHDLARSTHSRQ